MKVPILFLMISAGSFAQGTVTFQANGATSATTFTGNNVFAHVCDSGDQSTTFFVGRNDPSIPVGTNDGLAEYAVSQAYDWHPTMFRDAPVTVRLNGVDKQPSPVAGQKISLMGLYSGSYGGKTPFVVTADAPQNLYWNLSSPGASPYDIFSITDIKDANGATTAGVVAAAGASIRENSSGTSVSGSFIFATVKPNGAAFGGVGSGTAMIGQVSNALGQAAAVMNDAAVKSVPLDGTQSYVKITNNATITATAPDTYFDPVLNRMYTCYSVTTGAVAADGARGLVVTYLNPVTVNSTTVLPKCITSESAPAAAYAGLGTTAVGGLVTAGGAITGSYLKFRSLYTSTGLTYGLLVGSSSGVNPSRRVSAVPLVNQSVNPENGTWPTDPVHGSIASKIIAPGTNLQTYFNTRVKLYNAYLGRGFQVPATTPADMPLEADDAVFVGGALAPGTINDIIANKDTVFVATNGDDIEAAGVFASQALFDANAAIKGWTPWQRVATPTKAGNTIYGIGYQPTMGKLFTMEGASAATVDTVLTTTWDVPDKDGLLGGTTTNAAVGFVNLIDNQFSDADGGIQAAFDFPKNTVGFGVPPHRLSAMMFTGYKQVVLAQTGSEVAAVFTPAVGNFSTNMQISTNGAITAPGAGALIISVSGGALATVGAITSGVVISDNVAFGYFVVGGVGGLAVLKPGWVLGGLGLEEIADLPASAFTLMGSYKNIRKLWSDGTNLYVLTNDTFDRIPATQLAGTTLTPVTLATPAILPEEYGQFSDVAVSAKVALLATSQGLFRTGNGADVSTATTPTAMAWTAVTLPESQLAVTRFQPLSPTGLPEGFSRGTTGGTVYVLAGSVDYNLASLYRIAVASTAATAVVDATVQVIPDYFVQGRTSAFAALGAYRNYTTTFGALVTASETSYDGTPPVFEALPPFLRTGVWIMPNRNVQIPLDNATTVSISNLLRNSGVGSLILPTNNGMRVLE